MCDFARQRSFVRKEFLLWLDALSRLFPLDIYTDKPVVLMDVLPGDTVKTPIWASTSRLSPSTTSARTAWWARFPAPSFTTRRAAPTP